MNAFSGRITPALCEAADDREARAAALLIERYLSGLRVAIRNADRYQRVEARMAQAKVRHWKNAIAAGEWHAAHHALVFLGPNDAGPWIETVIAAGERRSAARNGEAK